MNIYYIMIEAVPRSDNPESRELGGAYINCWVKAATQKEALIKAREYVDWENWIFIKTEDVFIAQRHFYFDEPASLECYDEACESGISAAFYTWPIDEKPVN